MSTPDHGRAIRTYWINPDAIQLADFLRVVSERVDPAAYPFAATVSREVLVYDRT
jgi:hypothetical protein